MDWDWNAEASRLGVSLVHFRRLFRNYAGCPLKKFVIQCKMDAAAQLLRSTFKPVKSVAYEVGFTDIQYFTKQFRDHFGLPPNSYRKSAQTMYRPKAE